MSDPRAFISFDFDHNEIEKHLFVGQSKNSKTPFFIEDWSSKTSLPQNQWENIIDNKINKCNMLIILVGKYMASASGVSKEIGFAKKNNVPIFGIYVGGADTNSNLPIGLPRNRTISWNWDYIEDAIRQVMNEDKNEQK